MTPGSAGAAGGGEEFPRKAGRGWGPFLCQRPRGAAAGLGEAHGGERGARGAELGSEATSATKTGGFGDLQEAGLSSCSVAESHRCLLVRVLPCQLQGQGHLLTNKPRLCKTLFGPWRIVTFSVVCRFGHAGDAGNAGPAPVASIPEFAPLSLCSGREAAEHGSYSRSAPEWFYP